MPSYLVTGGNGQLAKCFKEVRGEFSNHRFFFENKDTVDITNPETLKKSFDSRPFDGIINCAGYTQVDFAEEEYEKAKKINVEGLRNISVFAEEKELCIVNFSSDYIFDGTSSSPYKENDKPNPINKYGYSKYKGELLLEKTSCQHTTFRISWLFSPFEENFVKTILKLSKVKEIIQVVNDQHGRPTYGIDLARTVLSNISKPDFFDFNSYNYAMQGTTTWFDFASKILAIKKSTCQIKSCSTAEYPTLAKRPKHSVLDTKRIENHLSLNIASWENSLKRCLKRIDNNEKI